MALYEALTEGFLEDDVFLKKVTKLARKQTPEGYPMELVESDMEAVELAYPDGLPEGVELGSGSYGKTKLVVPADLLADFCLKLRDVGESEYEAWDYEVEENPATGLWMVIVYTLTHPED